MRSGNQNGIALFIVLWVLTLLSVMVAEFAFATRTAVNMVRNFKEETQAYYLARSGVNVAVAALFADQLDPGRRNPDFSEDSAVFPSLRESTSATFGWPDGKARLAVRSLSGKVNLNRAGPRLLLAMLTPFDLEEKEAATIVDSIMDWRDADSLHRVNGAENAYYRSLSEPYSAKNGDFDSLAELLRVRGVSEEMFYGGLNEMVTIFPKNNPDEKREFANGKKPPYARMDFDRVDINNIDHTLLTALPGMNPDTASAVLERRRDEPFQSIEELRDLLRDEVFAKVFHFLTVSEIPVYRIHSRGERSGTKIRRDIEAIVEIDLTAKPPCRFLRWRDVAPGGEPNALSG